jgi:hypothetical protein
MPKIDSSSGPDAPLPAGDRADAGAVPSQEFQKRLEAFQQGSSRPNGRLAPGRSSGQPAGQAVIDSALRGDAQANLEETQVALGQAEVMAEQKADAAEERSLAVAAEESPLSNMDEAWLQNLAAQLNADPNSMNMKLLRLQFRMQRESQCFTFLSNKVKGDDQDNKVAINNIK